MTEIAKIAELKRSIVYVIVDELREKGYVSLIPNRKVNTYQAVDPGLIHNQIKIVSKQLGEMLPFLRSLQNKGEKKPRMHFVETKEGILKTWYSLADFQKQFYISSAINVLTVFFRANRSLDRNI